MDSIYWAWTWIVCYKHLVINWWIIQRKSWIYTARVEGSLSAVGGGLGNSCFGDGNNWNRNANVIACDNDIQSHPAYLSYYHFCGNACPLRIRLQAGWSSLGRMWDFRKKTPMKDGNDSSLFSIQPAVLDFQLIQYIKPRLIWWDWEWLIGRLWQSSSRNAQIDWLVSRVPDLVLGRRVLLTDFMHDRFKFLSGRHKYCIRFMVSLCCLLWSLLYLTWLHFISFVFATRVST